MTFLRVLLLLAGLWLAWYGISLLLTMNITDLESVALWSLGGIVLHDVVFAPACAAAGLTARKLLSATSWAPLACGAACTVTLLLIAVPVIGREYAVTGNPSVLNRPYVWGLVGALAVVWGVVGLILIQRSGPLRIHRRRTHPNPR
ncbi:hypothetical protein OH799_30860 [Nocardia sp. NBC_00881]|uniref:hypothetical protein n=1 Tax=Nocardia sp. NBC_00881 TaxID=2975995 RepID=UPI003870AED9|nr:hypothetical protein OH799_30860 [Nocardia sp. NBC_00881]